MWSITNNMDKFVIDEEYAMKIFRHIRWTNGVYCPKCKSFDIYNRGMQKGSNKQPNRYSCNSCGSNFNDFTDTLFENGNVAFGKILYILVHIGHKSTVKLAKELKLHRNTVGRYHKKIREFLLENNVDPQFNGEIEMDEFYVIAGEKGIKKTPKMTERLEKEA